MLIEVHIIQNHAPSNLNRDESGSPKSAIFGGYRRARISSQCLKRCYRTSKTFRNEVDGLGVHTCAMPDEVIRRVGKELTDDEQNKLKAALAKVIKKGEGGGGDSSDSGQGKEAQGQEVEKAAAQKDKLKTAQSVFWRETELEALAAGVRQWAQEDKSGDFNAKAALKEVGLSWAGIPVDMALFGRMVTSELMHNVEASSQFAHAISTHEFAREFDLWTRVDDRRDKRLDFYEAFGPGEKLESGTDGMGDAEFTSACYYSYFNVEFCALVDNLTGKALKHDLDDSNDKEEARRRACRAVIGLLKAAIFERPTGKFNSMATPSLPSLVLVEVRDSHVPVSYADAFAKPVDPKNEETLSDSGQVQRVGLPEESARCLIKEANRITRAFCRSARNRLLFTGGRDLGVSLDRLDSAPGCEVETVDDLVEVLRADLESAQEEKDA
ncbi:MAG: type I-E CRISPR-associated protein Cas7/Cse4/CasC [Thermodesulfobacteriota bacterium]